MDEHGGVFPSDYEEHPRPARAWGTTPPGPSASIAFGLPVPAVDGNVLRVAARITGDGGDITSPAMKKRVTEGLPGHHPPGAPPGPLLRP